MIYAFLIILLMMIVINISITQDLLHPTILFKSIWFLSLLVYVFFKETWGFHITNQTLGIFMMGFICFDIGFLFFLLINNKKTNQTSINLYRLLTYNRVILLLMLVIVVSLTLFMSMINTVGVNTIFSKEFFVTFRNIQYDGSGEANTETHLFNILKALGIAILIYYLTDKSNNKNKKVIYILSIFIFIITMIFSTGRMWLLSLVIQALVISTMNTKKKGTYFKLETQLNYLKKIMGLGFTFLIFFFVYGKVTADKIDYNNAINKIAVYMASPLIAFNESWEERAGTSQYFGEYLLSPLYNIIEKLFFIKIIQPLERPPYIFGGNGFATNVYTFYDSQIKDFGIIAIPFVMFLIGFFISYLKYKSEKEMIVGFWTAVYAYFIYSLAMSFFNDKFFASSTSTFLTIILYFIIFKTKIINKSKYIEKER